MSIGTFYIINIVFITLVSFAQLSRGSLFSDALKGAMFIVSIILLIALCIIATINYSWLHIIGLIVAYFVAIWVSTAILKATIFKEFQ